jgi:DNA-binding MurR/RpiR family transcriptional regulator
MFTGDPLDKMLSSLEELYRDFRASLDRGELDIIAAAMHDARRVVIFPYGVMLSENYLQSDLFMSGIPCDIIIGDKAQLEAAKSLEIGELALVLSPDCIDAVAPLKNLTSVIKSKMARLCTISGTPGKMQNDNADIAITLNGRQSILDTYIMELYLAALDMRYRSLYLDKMQ